MMAIDEGNNLITEDQSDKTDLVDNCINNSSLRTVWILTVCLALGNAADAVEIICVGYIMTYLGDEISTSDKEYLTAAVFVGMLVGGICCGYMSDIVGRKPALVSSLLLNAVAGITSCFVPSVSLLIVCRVVAGLGIGGSVPAVFSLGAELFPAQIRGRQLSIVASFWMVGAIYTATTGWIMLGTDISSGTAAGAGAGAGAGVGMATNSIWRWFAGVSAIPALAALAVTVCYIPESPRFVQ